MAAVRYPSPNPEAQRRLFASIDRVLAFPQTTTVEGHNPIALRLTALEIPDQGITEYTIFALMRHLATEKAELPAVFETHTVPILYGERPLTSGCRPDYCGRARLSLGEYGATILSCAGPLCADPYDSIISDLETMATAPEITPELRSSLPARVLSGNGHAFDHYLIATQAQGLAFDGPRPR